MSDFIKTEHLSFSYEEDPAQGGIPALKNVNITIQKGEYIAILGHNGSGKSTLAKLFNMILFPTDGAITVDGVRVDAEGADEDTVYAIRRKIGMVFQNPDNQLVASVIEEDVAFGPENLGIPSAEIRERVTASLAAVGMSGYERRAPHHLSGGQKQRIAIAGVIAMRPACIVFDESTAMLDPVGRQEVLSSMEKLNREGMTVIHITHYMEEAARASRVIVINDGVVRMDGTPGEVFSRVRELEEMGLGVPQGTELLHRLASAGLSLPAGVVDPTACEEALFALLGEDRDGN